MKYRIREVRDINTGKPSAWYPQYRKHWYSYWMEGSFCASEELARLAIKGWKINRVVERNKYIECNENVYKM